MGVQGFSEAPKSLEDLAEEQESKLAEKDVAAEEKTETTEESKDE